MIIINAGVPKSGTSLLYNYQKDMLARCYQRDFKSTLGSDGFGLGYRKKVNISVLKECMKAGRNKGGVVVKTHGNPTLSFDLMMHLGMARSSYCIRDPRDVILSAIDHGKRTRQGLDKSGAFNNCIDVQSTVRELEPWFVQSHLWFGRRGVVILRYEEFMHDKLKTLRLVNKHMNTGLFEDELLEIYSKHEALKKEAWNFNKGDTFRYLNEMSLKEIDFVNRQLKHSIVEMGYKL